MVLTNIFAGFGGQGVLLIGQLIAYAGMYEGRNVSWLPSYGPEMRGGTANCSVVVSDDPIASRMKVSTLIESLPGYGKAKAAKIMEELGISATRRVQGLGVRQREQLLEQLTK